MGTLVRAAWIAVAGAAAGVAWNAARGDGVPLLRPVLAEAAASQEACAAPAVEKRVSQADALALHREKRAVFLDVRPPAAYAEGHVAEAMHLPCQSAAPAWLARVARDRTLVIYDAGGDDAALVAQSLGARGHRDVRVLAGGFAAWRAAAGPAEAGTCGACQ